MTAPDQIGNAASKNFLQGAGRPHMVYRRKLGDASFMGDLLKLIWWAVIKLFQSRPQKRKLGPLQNV